MSTPLIKTNRIIALLLVIAISLSGTGSSAVRAQAEGSGSSLPDGWQIYVDSEYGFQVGYPVEGWTGAVAFQNDIQAEDGVLKRFTIQNTESAFINIDIWNNPGDLSIPEWIDLRLKSLLDETAVFPTTSNITMAGMEGFFIVQPPNLESQLPGRIITLLSNNGFIYQIEYIAQDDGAAQGVYLSVLETFEFGSESTQPDSFPQAPFFDIQEPETSAQSQEEYVEVQGTSFSKSSPADKATGVPTTVTLKWNALSPAPDRYRYSITTSETSSDWTGVSGTQVTVNLSPNTKYNWQVQAIYCSTCAQKEIVSANSGDWWTFTTQQTYPSVTSIVRSSPTTQTTNAASVVFSVKFSEDVTGVDTGDFRLTTTGAITGAIVSSVSGSGSTYLVAVNTGSGDGTLRLDVTDNDTIKNVTNGPLGGGGVTNGNFIKGQTYTIDKTPSVLSITLKDANPTIAVSANFIVTFSIAVTGVDVSDFVLTTAGITGAGVVSVSGSGTTYTVNVNTGSGLGTIRLDVVDDDTILDTLNYPLGGAGGDNGSFNAGSSYTMIAPPKPASLLRLPPTNDSTPTLTWSAVPGAERYEIQWATDLGFTQDMDADFADDTTFTFSTPLSDGTYYWHVRTYDARNSASVWSGIRSFTIDTQGPTAPVLQTPANDGSIRGVPTFRWSRVSDAVLYEFELDDNLDFSSTLFSVEQRTWYRRLPGGLRGAYYWRVRARDAAGNWGAWSPTFTVNFLRLREHP